jgi:hypothetical protein
MMMEGALRKVGDLAGKIEGDSGVERKIRKVSLLEGLGPEPYAPYRKALEEMQRVFEGSIERFRKHFEIMLNQVQRVTKHVVHRAQGRSSGAGKSTAKKSASASSSGSDGGDGGGDGDGPHRTPSKTKKNPPSKSKNTALTRSPRSSTREIVASSPQQPPQSPPPHKSPGLAYLCTLCLLVLALITDDWGKRIAMILLFLIAICALGHPGIAKEFLTSKAIAALISRLSGKPGDN